MLELRREARLRMSRRMRAVRRRTALGRRESMVIAGLERGKWPCEIKLE